MHAAFRNMAAGILSVLGEDSFLRGTVACRVNIENGVQVIGNDDNVVVERDVATILAEHNPKVGDVLTHPDGTYRLDAVFKDNGASKQFIILKLP